MATAMDSSDPTLGGKSHSIVDDFMYGSNVASSHVYVRLGFLRKVYSILSIQLLITTLTGALFMYVEPIKTFVQGSSAMIILAFILSLVTVIALLFKRHEYPTNMFLLAAFTLVEAYTIGTVVTFYDQMVVLEAFALTVSVAVCLTIYTLQSTRDFSSWGAGLFSMLWIMIMAGFLRIFFQSDTLELIYAMAGAALFCGFIIYDTHMLMHKLSPEEYIVATINLYLDLINLFMYILRILSELNKKK
ncbi:protein lifeguard 4-like [Ptychodera flava]|uniref:protein lifeguard 4-like n=1 Tax=Ptychodera flava TaxID=63121 RepID=UPI00396A5BCA